MTKGSLWNDGDRAGLVSRLNRLTPQNERRWGEIESSRLLPHMGDGLRMALGEIEPRRGKGFVATALMRRLIIHVLPWPKGAKSPREGFTTEPSSWDEDHATLLELIERFGKADPSRLPADNPIFGRMKPHDWDMLQFRHLDHHLTQWSA